MARKSNKRYKKRRRRNIKKSQRGGSIASSFFRFLADSYEKENIEDKERKQELKIKQRQEQRERNLNRERVNDEIYEREKRENEQNVQKHYEDEDLRIIDTRNDKSQENVNNLQGGGNGSKALLLASFLAKMRKKPRKKRKSKKKKRKSRKKRRRSKKKTKSRD